MTNGIGQADIVEVALGLLAKGGLHALAMRRIANELGVQQSALYWHFDNKQQLLAAVADRVVAPVQVRPDADWSTQVEALASDLRRELLRYPDGAELVATVLAYRLGGRRPFEQFRDTLTAAGMSPSDAEVAASVLVHFVLGFVTDQQQHHQAAELGAIDRIEGDDAASTDDRFIHGIGLIVTGVEAQRSTAR